MQAKDGKTYNLPNDPDFAGYNKSLVIETCSQPTDVKFTDFFGTNFEYKADSVEAWCNGCVHAETYSVDELSNLMLWSGNVGMMGPYRETPSPLQQLTWLRVRSCLTWSSSRNREDCARVRELRRGAQRRV